MLYNNKKFTSGKFGGNIMAVLENCEPKHVFHYFEEICKIPHDSGNTKKISD